MPLRPPTSFPDDVAALVASFTSDGKAHICGVCKEFAGSFRRLREFALDTAKTSLARRPQFGLGDAEGTLLIAALLTYAWAETNNIADKEPPPALASALELLQRFPVLPLRAGERSGPLNLVTRDLGHGTSLTFTWSSDDELYLLDFGSADPQRGHGRASFSHVIEIADRHSTFLRGVVKSHTHPGMDETKIMNDVQLLGWYKRFGFRVYGETTDGYAAIRRAPGPPHGYPYEQGDVR